MLSSLSSKDNGAGNSDLTNKIMGAMEPVIAEHWPKIEPYADQALAAAEDDSTVEILARKIYPWLPMVVRLAIKEENFVSFTLQHKAPFLAKLAAYKKEKGS